jgi:hypothetical protein
MGVASVGVWTEGYGDGWKVETKYGKWMNKIVLRVEEVIK